MAIAVVKNKNLARTSFKRIYDLPEDKKAALDNMFYEGVPVAKITSVLRDGWGYFKEVKDQTLTKFLFRYKWAVIDKNLAVRAETLEDQRKAGLLHSVTEDIDTVQELTTLIVVQKARVKKLLDREREMPMLFSSLGGEMKTLAGFIQQYSDLSFDLGMMKRIPRVTKLTQNGDETTIVESEGRAEVVYSLEATQKVETAAKVFFKLLDEVGCNAQPE